MTKYFHSNNWERDLDELSNHNGVRIANTATSKNKICNSTTFHIIIFINYFGSLLMEKHPDGSTIF
jgi:hypothetical protein